VTVYHGCLLGPPVVVHSSALLRRDGLVFVPEGCAHLQALQVGGLRIDGRSAVGGGPTVDPRPIGTTAAGPPTTIAPSVQIGHNVHVGPHCLIVAQVGISGSTRVGAGTVFAGQSGAAGHLDIGSRAMVASKSAVYDNLPDGAVVAGIPAMDLRIWRKAQAV